MAMCYLCKILRLFFCLKTLDSFEIITDIETTFLKRFFNYWQ